MVNWNARDIKEWKKEARKTQQKYYDLLGDREWDVIEKNEFTLLRRKIGYGLYGPPNETGSSDNRDTGYNKQQLEPIEKICNKLIKDLDFVNRNILFACIFVVGKNLEDRFIVPVFKAKPEDMKYVLATYVDSEARKYSSWTDYRDNNKLPKCIYCYPTSGVYKIGEKNRVCVTITTSPACSIVSRAFRVFDRLATVATVGATGVGLAALCTIPVAGPVMAASAVAGLSTSVYGVARSSHALYDRSTHSQSIALGDAEARGCWIAIVGSSLGFAHGRMIASITKAARAGEVMGKAGRIAFMIVQTGSLTVNGVGLVHGLAVLVDKSEHNDLTPLDVFQFSASVLFFSNAAVNFRTAGSIIKQVQSDIINNHREGLGPDALKTFDEEVRNARGPDKMHKNAEVVKKLKRIENTRELLEVTMTRDTKYAKDEKTLLTRKNETYECNEKISVQYKKGK